MCYFNYNFEDYIDNNSSTTSTDVTTVFTFNNSSSNTVQGTITKGNNNFGNFNGANIYNAFTLISGGTNVTTTPQNVNLVQTQGTLSTMYATGACPEDTDGDGLFDQYEAFDNGNGTYSPIDTDGDGLPNHLDIDDDGDGILSMYERNDDDENHNPNDALNTDGDGYPNYLDVDDDNDGYVTWEILEGGPGIFNAEIPTISNGLAYTLDTDADTIPNYLDNTNGNFQVTGPISVDNFISLIGDKRYELSNHLGNVLVVINDKKIPNLNGMSLINFNADVLSYNDYYPFGQLVPNRHGSSSAYRYGFQGQEKDDEIKGEGNSLNYTFRMHDPRVGRFFARDPLSSKYPYLTPYQFSSNQPIHAQELEGCESASEIQPYVGVSLNWGSNNKSVSLTGHATGNVGNWQGSVGGSVTLFEQFYSTGKGGVEFRGSFLGGFNDGNTNITFGTNYFKGLGGMSEFNQRTGIMNIGVGKFNFSYENDGFPFQMLKLSDGNDNYRSAAVNISFGKLAAGFNLFTGGRTSYFGDTEKVNKGIASGPRTGSFGEKMPYGYVNEFGKPYRFGAAFLSYGGTKIGIESDRYIRHAIQDNWAHDSNVNLGLFRLDTRQPGFKSLTDDIKPFLQFKDNPDNTSPRFSLYNF